VIRAPFADRALADGHLIDLRDVVKDYVTDAGPFRALKSVSVQVDAGEFIAVVGRSGSGKSTLLNLLGLLDTPTSGALIFDGVPLEKLTGAERDRRRGTDIGFIFQQFNLLGGRTALENVMTPLLYAEGKRYAERLASVGALVEHHVVVGADHGYDGTDDARALASYALIARHLKDA